MSRICFLLKRNDIFSIWPSKVFYIWDLFAPWRRSKAFVLIELLNATFIFPLGKLKKRVVKRFLLAINEIAEGIEARVKKIAFLALNACFYLGSNKIEILKYYPGLCTQFDKWIENDKTCEMFVWEKRGI